MAENKKNGRNVRTAPLLKLADAFGEAGFVGKNVFSDMIFCSRAFCHKWKLGVDEYDYNVSAKDGAIKEKDCYYYSYDLIKRIQNNLSRRQRINGDFVKYGEMPARMFHSEEENNDFGIYFFLFLTQKGKRESRDSDDEKNDTISGLELWDICYDRVRQEAEKKEFGSCGTNTVANNTNYLNGKNAYQALYKVLDSYSPESEILKYILPLAWILQAFAAYVIPRKNIIINRDPERRELQIGSEDYYYQEYYSLTTEYFQLLSSQISKHMGDIVICENFFDLAKYITSVIERQILELKPISYKKFESVMKNAKIEKLISYGIIVKDDIKKSGEKISLDSNNVLKYVGYVHSEKTIFDKYISSYGKKSIDRFRLLERIYKHNAYAAAELGDIYYSGASYDVAGNQFIIKSNIRKALDYYAFSMTLPREMSIPNACWSIGSIVQYYVSFKDDMSGERVKTMIHYYEMAGDFPPALLNLAYIYQAEGEKAYLTSKERCGYNNGKLVEAFENYVESGNQAANVDVSEIVSNYCKFLQYALEAFEKGWIYAGNGIALFISKCLSSERVMTGLLRAVCSEYRKSNSGKNPFINPTLIDNEQICIVKYVHAEILSNEPDFEEIIKELYRFSSILENPWSMVEYSRCIIKSNKDEAKRVLERASELGYGKATCVLAENYYLDDPKLYKAYLQKAVSQNYNRAKVLLDELLMGDGS